MFPGVSLDFSKDKLLEFTKQKEMTWPQYFDGKTWDNKVSGNFGIGAIPAMWLVDKRGYVRSTNARHWSRSGGGASMRNPSHTARSKPSSWSTRGTA